MFYILGQLLGVGAATIGDDDIPANGLTLDGEALTLDGEVLTIGS